VLRWQPAISVTWFPRHRADHRRLLHVATLMVGALQWLGAPAAAAGLDSRLDIVAVIAAGADRQVTLVADIRPATATPVPAESFSVTAGDMRLRTRAVPVLSDRLAVGLILDASARGAPAMQAGLSGAAGFLLQLPTAARMAAVTDTSPPAVVAPLQPGAADALGALNGVRSGGERHTSDAVSLALQQLPDTPDGPRLVVLYTNARDAGGEPQADLAGRLAKAHALLAVVTTGTDRRYWSRVTAETGGVLVTATAANAMAAFDDVAETLRGRYLLTFPLPDQLPAHLSVQVRTADGTLSAKSLVTGGGIGADPASDGGGTGADPPGGAGGGVLRIVAVAVGAVTVVVWLLALTVRRRAQPAAGRGPRVAAIGSAAAGGSGPTVVNVADRAYMQVDTQVSTAAAAVEKGRLDPRRAVAQIALAASGRPDLLDRAAETERRMAGSKFAQWPPMDTVLTLIEAARRVTIGEVALIGPDGVRVEQAALADHGITRPLLRLSRNDQPVCDCQTVRELAQHVDLSSLIEEPTEEPGKEPTEEPGKEPTEEPGKEPPAG
jgi:hypothetical protein